MRISGHTFAHLTGKLGGGDVYEDVYGTLLDVDGQTNLVTVSYQTGGYQGMAPAKADAIMAPVLASLQIP